MPADISRPGAHLNDGVGGAKKFTLVLQPLMATIFAIKNGMKDAREGKGGDP